jgi:hypothetical protein
MAHECDCGARYSNLDALMACRNSNHGASRRATMAERERCARIAEGQAEFYGGFETHEWLCNRIAALIRAQEDEE